MKKLFSFLAIVSALTIFPACNGGSTPGCVVQGGVDLILAPAIAVGLQCSNESAVVASLDQVGQKIGLCVNASPAPTTAGGVLQGLCSTLGDALLSQLSGQIPSAWGCTATNAQAALGGVITAACNLIPAVQSAAKPH